MKVRVGEGCKGHCLLFDADIEISFQRLKIYLIELKRKGFKSSSRIDVDAKYVVEVVVEWLTCICGLRSTSFITCFFRRIDHCSGCKNNTKRV